MMQTGTLKIKYKASDLNPGTLNPRDPLSGNRESLQKRMINHKLILPTQYGFRFIPFDKIEALKADSNYTEIRLINEERVMVSKTLKSFERKLDDRFYRIHNSTFINLAYIKEVNRGKSYIKMDSGRILQISRNRKKQFLELLKSQCHD